MNIRLLIFISIFNTALNFSQQNKSSIPVIESFFDDLNKFELALAKKRIDSINVPSLQKQLNIYFDVKTTNGYQQHNASGYISTIQVEKEKKNLSLLLDLLILVENEAFYNRISAYDLAYQGYKLAKKLNYDFLQRQFLINILSIYRSGIVNNDQQIQHYLDALYNLSIHNNLYLFKYYLYKVYLNEMGLLKGDTHDKILSRRKITTNGIQQLDTLIQLLPNKKGLLMEYFHIKARAAIAKQNNKEALVYFTKEQELLNRENHIFYNKLKYESYKETARNFSLMKKYTKAMMYLKKTKIFQSKLTPLRNTYIYNLYISDIYFGMQQKDSAYFALKKAFQSNFSLSFKKQNNLISSLEVKNKTKEKDHKILMGEQKIRQNRNLLFLAAILISLGSIIAYLTLKNSRKKRLLAEQQQELEQQKNLTLLKEQELHTINAMVEGQEKERIKIAEDLHDNIGSVLATLKLHFENLKLNRDKQHFDQEKLYQQTEKLIDETYLKVRSIAHAKNAGVLANQSLLVAITIMAKKISDANAIQIEVLDYGLDNRLENNLEITVFRIVQELTTNIIKHAQATKATINISLFDNTLNIIIEDNGKGFDPTQIKSQKGMGLYTIQTRIKHLKGTIDIDSTTGKGTSIIMNFPVA